MIAATQKKAPTPWQFTLLGALAAPLVYFAIFHGIQTRHWTSVFGYPLYFAIPATGIAYVVAILASWSDGRPKFTSTTLGYVFGIPLFIYAASITYYMLGASAKDGYIWIRLGTFSQGERVALAVGATLYGGVVLFLFRYYCRSIYGLSETLVGLMVAASRVWNNDIPASDPSLYLAILTAGVYLVVRGLDNIYQGIVSQPRDRVVDVLMRRMERDMTHQGRLAITEAK